MLDGVEAFSAERPTLTPDPALLRPMGVEPLLEEPEGSMGIDDSTFGVLKAMSGGKLVNGSLRVALVELISA